MFLLYLFTSSLKMNNIFKRNVIGIAINTIIQAKYVYLMELEILLQT